LTAFPPPAFNLMGVELLSFYDFLVPLQQENQKNFNYFWLVPRSGATSTHPDIKIQICGSQITKMLCGVEWLDLPANYSE
jgi:hypothetical protein